MALFDKIIVLDQFGRALDNLIEYLPAKVKRLTYNSEKRTQIADAILCLQNAIKLTQKHIKAKGYIPSSKLQDAWSKAFHAFVKANIREDMEEWMVQKMEFWEDPQQILSDPDRIKFVPKLGELKIKTNSLLKLLK